MHVIARFHVLFFIFYDVQKDHYVQNITPLCTNYLVLILSEKVLPTLFQLSIIVTN